MSLPWTGGDALSSGRIAASNHAVRHGNAYALRMASEALAHAGLVATGGIERGGPVNAASEKQNDQVSHFCSNSGPRNSVTANTIHASNRRRWAAHCDGAVRHCTSNAINAKDSIRSMPNRDHLVAQLTDLSASGLHIEITDHEAGQQNDEVTHNYLPVGWS